MQTVQFPPSLDFQPIDELGAKFCSSYNGMEQGSTATWFYLYDSQGLQIRDTLGESIGSFEIKDIQHDTLLEIVEICHVSISDLDLLLLLIKAGDDSHGFVAVDPFSLTHVSFPIRVGFKSVDCMAVTSTSQGINYIIYAAKHKFCVFGISLEDSFQPAFTNPLEVELSSSNRSNICSVYAHLSFNDTSPLFFVGTDRGLVEIWKLTSNSDMKLVNKVKLDQSPISHICFNDSNIDQSVLLVGQASDSSNKQISAFVLDAHFTASEINHGMNLDTGGVLKILKLVQDRHSFNIFTAYEDEQGNSEIRIHVQFETDGSLEKTTAFGFDSVVVDLEPFGTSSSCHLLTFNQISTFFDDVQIPQQFDMAIPRFSDWFNSDIANFTYKPQVSMRILKNRQLCGGTLLFDELLALLNLEGYLLYPPKEPRQFELLFEKVLECEVELVTKHSILYYLLKDESQARATSYANDFLIPHHFLIAMDGFWEFDNGNYSSAVKFLSDASVDINWNGKIISILVQQGYYDEAFQYFVSKKSVLNTLEIEEVLMASFVKRDFYMALSFHRKANKSLLNLLLKECFEPKNSGFIKHLIGTKFNENEEKEIISYCIGTQLEICIDFLLVYFFQHNRMDDLFRYHHQFYGRLTQNGSGAKWTKFINEIQKLLPPIMRKSSSTREEVLQAEPEKELTFSQQVKEKTDQKSVLVALQQHRIAQDIKELETSFEIVQEPSNSFEVSRIENVDDTSFDINMNVEETQAQKAHPSSPPFLYPPITPKKATPVKISPSPRQNKIVVENSPVLLNSGQTFDQHLSEHEEENEIQSPIKSSIQRNTETFDLENENESGSEEEEEAEKQEEESQANDRLELATEADVEMEVIDFINEPDKEAEVLFGPKGLTTVVAEQPKTQLGTGLLAGKELTPNSKSKMVDATISKVLSPSPLPTKQTPTKEATRISQSEHTISKTGNAATLKAHVVTQSSTSPFSIKSSKLVSAAPALVSKSPFAKERGPRKLASPPKDLARHDHTTKSRSRAKVAAPLDIIEDDETSEQRRLRNTPARRRMGKSVASTEQIVNPPFDEIEEDETSEQRRLRLTPARKKSEKSIPVYQDLLAKDLKRLQRSEDVTVQESVAEETKRKSRKYVNLEIPKAEAVTPLRKTRKKERKLAAPPKTLEKELELAVDTSRRTIVTRRMARNQESK